jgi:hypothetical protein
MDGLPMKYSTMQPAPLTFFNVADFVPTLREQFERRPPAADKMIYNAFPVEKSLETGGKLIPTRAERRFMVLTDGEQTWDWEAESLRGLWRGNQQPPVLGAYPEAYNDVFIILDFHALELCGILGDRPDAEMKEIFAALRRRPDGRSLGAAHDYMWRAVALVLGTRPLSQAEFEAILARLERSCRTFEDGPASRNYIAVLRSTIGRA